MRKFLTLSLVILLLTALTSCSKKEQTVRQKDAPKDINAFLGTVKSPNLQVLDQPNPDGKVVEKFPWGTKFKLVDRSIHLFNRPVSGGIDYYYKIKFKDGSFAWVYGDDLVIEKPEIEQSTLGKTYLTLFPTGNFEKPYRAWDFRCFGYEAPRVSCLQFADVCDSKGAELITVASKLLPQEKEAPKKEEPPKVKTEKKEEKPTEETTPKEKTEEEISALMTPQVDEFASPEVVPVKEEKREVWVCVLNQDVEQVLYELPHLDIIRSPQRIDEIELRELEVGADYYAILLLVTHNDLGKDKKIVASNCEGWLYLFSDGGFQEIWRGPLTKQDSYNFWRDEEGNFRLE